MGKTSRDLKIGIIDVSNAPPGTTLERGIRWLERRKIDYRLSPTLMLDEQCSPLFCQIDRKIEAFMEMLLDESINVMLPAAGDYGCAAFVHALDKHLNTITDRAGFAGAVCSKVFVVFSDTTALLLYLMRFGARGFYGRNLSIDAGDSSGVNLVLDWLAKKQCCSHYHVESCSPGEAKGHILGGDWRVLSTMVSTQLCCPIDGSILFIDNGGGKAWYGNETVFRLLEDIHRMTEGKEIRGLLVGEIKPQVSSEDLLLSLDMFDFYLSKLNISGPVTLSVPVGHKQLFGLMPLGFDTDIKLSDDSMLSLAWEW